MGTIVLDSMVPTDRLFASVELGLYEREQFRFRVFLLFHLLLQAQEFVDFPLQFALGLEHFL